MFNLDRLNERRLEWVHRDAWGGGKIPKDPEPLIGKWVDLVMGLKYTDFKQLAKTLMDLTFCLTLTHITLFIVTQ